VNLCCKTQEERKDSTELGDLVMTPRRKMKNIKRTDRRVAVASAVESCQRQLEQPSVVTVPGGGAQPLQLLLIYLDHPVVHRESSNTPPPPQTMAIGKAARWISFATTQQTPTSSSVTQDTFHPAVSFADEKQFGLENVRYHPSRSLFPFL
jgi:hypothetical protein